jgi:transposase
MAEALMRDVVSGDVLSEPEGARRATVGSERTIDLAIQPSPEVSDKTGRRRFTVEYKLKVLREVDACKVYGDIGALLRREGLYSTHLSIWRKQRREGSLAGLWGKKRGRKASDITPQVKQLQKENAQLERRLERAEAIIAIQKKVSELLGIPLKGVKDDEKD